MQDATQDVVCDKHEQMGMAMPPKVLRHKHNCRSVQSVNNDQDAKEQERERVCVWFSRRTMSMQ